MHMALTVASILKYTLQKAYHMLKDYSIAHLCKRTEEFRKKLTNYFVPNHNDPKVPPSVFKYKPVTFEHSPGRWHTIFGMVPDVGIWTVGTSPFEAMQEFDKELQLHLDRKGTMLQNVELPLRQRIHKHVWDKINLIMGW